MFFRVDGEQEYKNCSNGNERNVQFTVKRGRMMSCLVHFSTMYFDFTSVNCNVRLRTIINGCRFKMRGWMAQFSASYFAVIRSSFLKGIGLILAIFVGFELNTGFWFSHGSAY